jgi:hypothetical protein
MAHWACEVEHSQGQPAPVALTIAPRPVVFLVTRPRPSLSYISVTTITACRMPCRYKVVRVGQRRPVTSNN